MSRAFGIRRRHLAGLDSLVVTALDSDHSRKPSRTRLLRPGHRFHGRVYLLGKIRGSWKSHSEVFRQRCRCEELTLSESAESWFALDFNKLAELCYCCGAELVESGFQSSMWFCRECKQRVETLNAKYGRPVIPMGRFDCDDRDQAVATLKTWTRAIVQDNLRMRGLLDADPVPLGIYLEALTENPIDKRVAFDRLFDHFRLNADWRR